MSKMDPQSPCQPQSPGGLGAEVPRSEIGPRRLVTAMAIVKDVFAINNSSPSCVTCLFLSHMAASTETSSGHCIQSGEWTVRDERLQ